MVYRLRSASHHTGTRRLNSQDPCYDLSQDNNATPKFEVWAPEPQTQYQRNLRAVESTWGIVKIMVPFWVPIRIRGLIRGLI